MVPFQMNVTNNELQREKIKKIVKWKKEQQWPNLGMVPFSLVEYARCSLGSPDLLFETGFAIHDFWFSGDDSHCLHLFTS